MADEARDWQVRVPTSGIEDRQLGRAAFRVFCCLKSFANAEGVCWPRVSTIGKRLGMERSTVSEHLATLERCGYSGRKPSPDPTGDELQIVIAPSPVGNSDRGHVGPADSPVRIIRRPLSERHWGPCRTSRHRTNPEEHNH